MILPDGFTASVLAAESIADVRVLLNGPAGCRNRYMVLVRQLFPREKPDDNRFQIPYFKGQSRVPCTYIDEDDFINGGSGKVTDALKVIKSVCEDTIVIIDSPGSALIGDDHGKSVSDAGMEGKAFALGGTLISMGFPESYDSTLRRIIEAVGPQKCDTIPRSVNIIGYPMTDKDWRHGLDHLRELLEAMGLTMTAAIGAGASLEDIRSSTGAEANIIVYPEFAEEVSEYMEHVHGIPSVRSPMGAPVGIDGTVAWVEAVAEALNVDPSPALEICNRARGMIKEAILGDTFRSKALQGMTFCIEGLPSMTYPLTVWLNGYLGMVPASIVNHGGDGSCSEDLESYLESRGLESVIGADLPDYCDVMITNGHDALHLQENRRCGVGIDLTFPSTREIVLLPKPAVGVLGSMYIVEEILNSM